MDDLTRISSTEFSKEVGRYQDLALTRAVIVTRNGRDRTVMISADEYGRLRREAGRAGDAAPTADSAGSKPAARQPAATVDAATLRAAASFLDRIRRSHASVSERLDVHAGLHQHVIGRVGHRLERRKAVLRFALQDHGDFGVALRVMRAARPAAEQNGAVGGRAEAAGAVRQSGIDRKHQTRRRPAVTGPVMAESYRRKAQRALAEVRILLEHEATEGACNRAYHAMHDAAHVALLDRGHESSAAVIKTHHGLIAEFGKHIVQGGHADAALGRDLNRVQTIRLAADYSCEQPSLEDAKAAVRMAEGFVAAIGRLIDASGSGGR